MSSVHRDRFFSRCTKGAQATLLEAQVEAYRFDCSFVEPEHILLALVGLPQTVAGWVLAGEGVTLEAARKKVRSLASRRAPLPKGLLPSFSAEAEQVLDLASKQALGLGHNYRGTEHLLLALFHVPSGTVLDVLQQFGLELEPIRRLLMQELERRGG